jgi:hypothetical protein
MALSSDFAVHVFGRAWLSSIVGQNIVVLKASAEHADALTKIAFAAKPNWRRWWMCADNQNRSLRLLESCFLRPAFQKLSPTMRTGYESIWHASIYLGPM